MISHLDSLEILHDLTEHQTICTPLSGDASSQMCQSDLLFATWLACRCWHDIATPSSVDYNIGYRIHPPIIRKSCLVPGKICKLKQYYNFIHTSTKINILFPILFSISTSLHQAISLPPATLHVASEIHSTNAIRVVSFPHMPPQRGQSWKRPVHIKSATFLSSIFIRPHRTHQSYFLFFSFCQS